MTNEALESVIRYARTKLMAEISEMDDKTEGIACKGLFPVYEQNHSYSVGDVRLHPTTGNPKECMTAYDGSVQQDWTIDTSRSGNRGTAGRKNMLCRGNSRPGHMTCTRQEST